MQRISCFSIRCVRTRKKCKYLILLIIFYYLNFLLYFIIIKSFWYPLKVFSTNFEKLESEVKRDKEKDADVLKFTELRNKVG